MNLRFCLLLTTVVVLSSSSLAARLPRMKDDVTKIAIGPSTENDSSAPSVDDIKEPDETPDSTDAVDKPILRPTVKVSDAPHGEVVEPSLTTPVEAAPTTKEKIAKPVEGVTAEMSQKWLENGNIRYVSKKFRADGRSEKDRGKKETKPHAIVLSCSDSRVPPELIFDQGLGEITTIRVAGEVLDSSVIASIEQTILNKNPHFLVVLGHTQCESIEAVMSWKEKATYGSDALDRMVSEIKRHLKTLTPGARSPGLQVEGALQADGVARELTERSEIIKKAVDDGQLTIKTGLYWVDTGKVKFY